MKKIRIRKWVKVVLVLIALYVVLTIIDKNDQEAIENCTKTNSVSVCERLVYGY